MDVSPEEAKEVALGDSMGFGFEKSPGGEDRWDYLGETSGGRIQLAVITTHGEKIRIITAYEPIQRIKRIYLEFKAENQ